MAALVSAGLLSVLPPAAMAQSEASATANAGATVVIPVTIVGVESLSFGAVQSDGANFGTVTVNIDPGGSHTRSATGGAEINPLGQGNFHPAKFNITGPPGAAYTVDVPTSIIQVRDMSGDPSAELIVLNLFTVSSSTGLSPAGQIGGDGTDMLFVSGTLQVTTIAEKGRYRGTITVTINLQ